MDKPRPIALDPPRFEARSWTFAGLRRRHARTAGVREAFDEQWSAAARRFCEAPDRQDGAGYGLVYDLFATGDAFELVTGVAVGEAAAPPRAFERLRLPLRRYAVFRHRGPISALRDTVWSAWYGWLPNQGLRSAADSLTPQFIESYGDDPANTGQDAVEVWFPVRA